MADSGGTAGATPTGFTNAEAEGLRDYWHVYEKHYDAIQKRLMEVVMENREFAALIRSIPAKDLEEQQTASRERTRRAIVEGAWDAYWSQLRTDGARYAQGGLSFGSWFSLVTAVRAEIAPLMVEEFKGAQPRMQACLHAMNKMLDTTLAVIGEEYLRTKEATIAKQAASIQELSTPVLQIRAGRLIMPLIGVIDTHRARQITEHLLEAIRAHRARVVIIDITGVPAVDSKVANHLIQTVEAARLMGAKTIVTGLSAEVAQTLVTLGVDLSKVRTVGDLQTGIEVADKLQSMKFAQHEQG